MLIYVNHIFCDYAIRHKKQRRQEIHFLPPLLFYVFIGFLYCFSFSLELEVDKGSHFGSHELDYELHGYDKNSQFNHPWRSHEESLHRISPALRQKMANYKKDHHNTPFRTGLCKLRQLPPVEIYEDILYYKNAILEARRPEKHP